jgi:hypothetical protein
VWECGLEEKRREEKRREEKRREEKTSFAVEVFICDRRK